MHKNNLRKVLAPITVALALVIGMYINSLFINNKAENKQELYPSRHESKLDMVLNMVNYSYVDTVDIKEIEENAIQAVIKDLDPHTVYIPAKEMIKVAEEMAGNFGGIGIQFYKYRDTVTVIKAIPGGPAERAGIRPGDRVVRVDDSLIAGVKMADKDIMAMMRGEVGTNVNVRVYRKEAKQAVFDKTLRRASIPVKSVDVAYMINDTMGYVKVNTFGMHTYDEFMEALGKLNKSGMKKLIVDLRSNEGGILPIALKMVNEFFDANKLIVYTEGKASPRSDYYSNGKGLYKNLPLVVLIDESSASASEIFAGAVQDNDRGMIIGRRSFGKGLVQEQRGLPDGSALRLTVARYYTASGRSIQRPYAEGKEKYYTDLYERILHGELEERDSTHFDEAQKYQTTGGRTVYGGGGIMPDIFVPADTVGYSNYLMKLSRSMQLYNYTFDFMDKHRKEMEGLKDYKEVLQYLKKYDVVKEMVAYAEKNGIKRDAKGLKESRHIIETQIASFIARHALDDEGFYPVIEKIDITLQKAISE
ncbi:S41 family peptidase [Porphyromonadaceae bacterium OttesenSCG-928-L07]|nr:S41 family peptidase [Porphyromonadaceae bacterium OttesenSCG-928-L07]MDL2330794.1 S41 family peptidase [Odoribacter sp. OttesenSCG-928-A06]